MSSRLRRCAARSELVERGIGPVAAGPGHEPEQPSTRSLAPVDGAGACQHFRAEAISTNASPMVPEMPWSAWNRC